MRNKKSLVTLSLLKKVLEVFSNFFLNIYLFKIVNGDFNFLLLYAAINAIAGCLLTLFFDKIISSKNANFIFRFGFLCGIASMAILLVLKEQTLDVIWLFALLQRIANVSYYVVYEVTLIRSTKTHSLSSYVAGVNILGSIITLIAPVIIGYTITSFSWTLIFILMLIDSIVSVIVASKVDFKVIQKTFRLTKYWKKVSKNRTMRQAYFATFLKRLSGTDGVLEYILPIMLFLTLGTEFSVGSYDSLFSIVYIIMLEIVRILNRRRMTKRIYIPLALLCLAGAAIMLADFTYFSVLVYYFTIKTGGTLIMTESSSMICAVGNKQKLGDYVREHQLTWNIFLTLGNLAGILIAFVIYNYFYSKEAFAAVIFALMMFFVLQAYFLQKIEKKLQNA